VKPSDERVKSFRPSAHCQFGSLPVRISLADNAIHHHKNRRDLRRSFVGGGWGLFAGLFLVADLFMLAYLAGTRAGAIAYNSAHSYFGPALLAALGHAAALSECLPLALIWVAHIAMDRSLGYGLNYATGFADTHLGRIGPPTRPAAQPAAP